MPRDRGAMPEDCLYGVATVGERGQIVIPADARRELDIQPGDRLLILKHPAEAGLVLFKLEAAREFMQRMLASLERAERSAEIPREGESG